MTQTNGQTNIYSIFRDKLSLVKRACKEEEEEEEKEEEEDNEDEPTEEEEEEEAEEVEDEEEEEEKAKNDKKCPIKKTKSPVKKTKDNCEETKKKAKKTKTSHVAKKIVSIFTIDWANPTNILFHFWNIMPTYIGIQYKQKNCRQ